MSASDIVKTVGNLVAHNDIRRLEILLVHKIPMHGADTFASRKALASGNLEMFKMLVENGACLKECEIAPKPDRASRDLYLLLHQLPDVQHCAKTEPEKYKFVKEYCGGILKNGIMSPPYTNIKMPMIAWALCLDEPATVFAKMEGHVKLTDDVFPHLTYRGLINRLGLENEYREYEYTKKLHQQNILRPLKRRVTKPRF